MEPNDGHFLINLRAKQQALGLSQRALAQRIGRSESLVSMVLARRRAVTLDFARKVITIWPEFSSYLAADLAAQSQPRMAPPSVRKSA